MAVRATSYEAFIELVKERVNIVEFLSQYTTLKRAGGRWTGLCPLHNEKSPSFSVNEEQAVWYCFGCGKGGNVFTFLREREGLEFKDAAQVLSERYHIPLELSRRESQERSELSILRDIHAAALEHFRKNLLDPQRGRPFQQYLRDRQFTRADADRFKLGAALDSFEALSGELRRGGFTPDQLVKAGVAARSERNPGQVYDRFRGRLIIPICDNLSRPIAFGGRIVLGQSEAKYLNSPETPLFHKGQTIFALDLARGSIKERRQALLMEGYTDVMRAHQRGATHAVAAMGTALTPEQMAELRKYIGDDGEVVLVMDSDAAGRQAAFKHAEALLKGGMRARVAILPGSKDPDEFLLANPYAAFEAAIAGALPAPRFMALELMDLIGQPDHLPADTGDRRELVKRAGPIFTLVPREERQELAEWVAGEVGLHADKVVEAIKQWIANRGPRREQGVGHPGESRQVEARPLERDLMRALVLLPETRPLALQHLQGTDFGPPAYQRLWRLFAERKLPLDHPHIEDLTLLQQYPEVQRLVAELMNTEGDPVSLEHFKRQLTLVREDHLKDEMARVQHAWDEASRSGETIQADYLYRELHQMGRLLVALRSRQWPEDLPEFQHTPDPWVN